MRKIFLLSTLALAVYFNSNAQGCVAIRSNGGVCTMNDPHDGSEHQSGNWLFGINSPNARRKTRSFGIGDVRLAAYYWLAQPSKAAKGNVQLGLGVKLPTGDYRYQDYFYKNDSVKVLGPVDQSIQLGDGGTGITT